MGLFKSIKKGFENGFDSVTGERRTKFGDSINGFISEIDSAINDADKSFADISRDNSGRTPPYILGDSAELTGFHRVNCGGMTFELPEEFTELSDGGRQVFMYKGNDGDLSAYIVTKPLICIIPATKELPLEKDKVQSQAGITTACSKNWVPDSGRIVKYFCFTQGGEEKLLAAFCRPDVIGSPFEPKLTYILYHAAETLAEQKTILSKE